MKNYYHGCLVSVAIGDALGMPLECMTKHQIDEYFGAPVDQFIEPFPYPGKWDFCEKLTKGQYTDDTQLTIALAECLIKEKKVSVSAVANAHLACYTQGVATDNLRGWGGSTKSAMEKLKEGTPWQHSGHPSGMGCGGAMKIAPLALFYATAVRSGSVSHESVATTLWESARDISLTTHKDTRCAVATAVQAYAVYDILHHHMHAKTLNREELVHTLAEYARTCESTLTSQDATISQVLDLVAQLHTSPLEEVLEKVGSEGNVLQSIPFSIYCFASTASYEQALVTAVNAGGDTDSVGAMVGALAGAQYGIDAIPSKWRGVEGYNHLCTLGTQLFDLK